MAINWGSLQQQKQAEEEWKKTSPSLQTSQPLQSTGAVRDLADIPTTLSQGKQEYLSGGRVMDFFDILQTGQYGVAGVGRNILGMEKPGTTIGESFVSGVKGRESWMDVLPEKAGVEGFSPLTAVGLGMDVALDPLWAIPPAKAAGVVGKGVNLLTKGKKLSTVMGVDKLVSKVATGQKGSELLTMFSLKAGRSKDFVDQLETAERVMGVDMTAGKNLATQMNKYGTKVKEEIYDVITTGSGKTSDEAATKLAHETVDFIKGFSEEGKRLGYLADETFDKYFGKYLRKSYLEYDTGQKVGQFVEKGLKPTGIPINPLKMRQDKWGVWYQKSPGTPSQFVEAADKAQLDDIVSDLGNKGYTINNKVKPLNAVEEGLTEIKDPAYALLKTVTEQTKIKEFTKLFNTVSEKWAKTADDIVKLGDEASGYRLMPEGDRWGSLSGKFVPNAQWWDLNRVINKGADSNAIQKFHAAWKANKTVLNPATHFRNMMSNAILNDMGGVPIHRVDNYIKAAKEYINKGPMYQEAKKVGLGADTYFGSEMAELLANIQKGKGGNVFTKLWDGYKGVTNKAGNVYQAEEEFFKLTHYMSKRAKGLDPLQAYKSAQKSLFDYSRVPDVVDKLRKYPVVGSPFLTFTYKAIPRVAETVMQAPTKISKFGKGMKFVEEMSPEDKVEEEKEVFKPYMQESGAYLRLPEVFNDETGRSRYLDLGYIFPWGSVEDDMLRPNTPVFSALVAGFGNKNMFTGREIWAETDTVDEKIKKFAIYFEDLVAPPLLGQSGAKILKAAGQTNLGERLQESILGEVEIDRDYNGRRYSLPDVLLEKILGIRTEEFSLEEERDWRAYEHEEEIKALEREIKKINERDKGERGKTQDKKLKKKIRQLEELLDQ